MVFIQYNSDRQIFGMCFSAVPLKLWKGIEINIKLKNREKDFS